MTMNTVNRSVIHSHSGKKDCLLTMSHPGRDEVNKQSQRTNVHNSLDELFPSASPTVSTTTSQYTAI